MVKKRVLATMMVAILVLTSTVIETEAKSVPQGKIRLFSQNSLVKTRKFANKKELREEFIKGAETADAIQVDKKDINLMDSSLFKEVLDNGCIICIEGNKKELEEAKGNLPFEIDDFSVSGMEVNGMWFQGNGNGFDIGYSGSKIFGDGGKTNPDKIQKMNPNDIIEAVNDQVKNQPDDISKKNDDTLKLQIPTGYDKVHNVACSCSNIWGTKMGTARIASYTYYLKTNSKTNEELTLHTSVFTVAPNSDFAVSTSHGFDAEISIGSRGEILDETALASNSPNTSVTLSGSVGAGPSMSGGKSYSYSTSGIDIINSLAEEKKRIWKCTPQSKVYEQARKIEPSILVYNKNYSKGGVITTSKFNYICFEGSFLGYSANDVLKVSDNTNSYSCK